MRLRHIARTCAASAALTLAIGTFAPAIAQEAAEPGTAPTPGEPDNRPEWAQAQQQGHPYAIDPRAREDWLTECRRRASARDNGLGGAVIGGLVGGFAGNRIAGRGNRTVGTIAGAAVGAAAGMAIDKSEDNGRIRDECETYLDDYYARYSSASYGYGYPAAGYGYGNAGYVAGNGCCQGAPMMMVPVRMMPRGEPKCTETVEYVEMPVRTKARRIPDKRVRIAPDKRIPQ